MSNYLTAYDDIVIAIEATSNMKSYSDSISDSIRNAIWGALDNLEISCRNIASEFRCCYSVILRAVQRHLCNRLCILCLIK